MTTIDIRPPLGARGAAVGLGLSMLVHVAVLAWLMRAPAPRPDAGEAPQRMVLVLLPPPPVSPPRTVDAPPVRPHATRPAPARRAEAPPVPSTPAITSAAPAAPPAEPDATPAQAAPPAVDLAAARAAARTIAREDARGLVALPGRKPVVDPNADHHAVDRLERARRIDCQTARAESTNLLANVVMLAVDLAKNAVDDSGCKW